jgi:PTH1 family peptidyl-tRNA hydrolase
VEEMANSAARKWSLNKKTNSKIAQFDDNSMIYKSMLFVNNTGASASAAALQNASSSKDFLFVCDDVNLDFGKMRLRANGSAGGHHGLESAIRDLGSNEFSRLRIGVRTENMPKDLTNFVLGKFSQNEREKIDLIVKNAAEVCKTWLAQGFEAAQNRLSQLQSVK